MATPREVNARIGSAGITRLPAPGRVTAQSEEGRTVDTIGCGEPIEQSVPLRILVVEPETTLLRLLCIGLRSRGYVVDSTHRPPPAELLAANEYALIILDLSPSVAGESALLTALAARPDQRVMVISDAQDTAWAVLCFTAGVVDYLRRPFDITELLARVQARLRAEPEALQRPQQVTSQAELTMDVSRRTADFGRGRVKLTSREFLMLRHMMSKPGQLVTRDEVLLEAWGRSADSSPNLVDSYVRRVRAKLGDDVIWTLHGRGYVFEGGGPSRILSAQV